MLPKIILNINKNYKRYLNNTGKRCHYSCLGWVFIAFTSWNTCSVSSDSNSESFCEEIDSVDSECWDAQFLPLLLVYINSHYCWCLFTENHTDGTKRELSVSPDELHDGQGKSGYSYCKEPSYFEIPTKELHSKPKTASQEVQEIPTKDTDHKPPATPPVVQGHASFTIEFDDQNPWKDEDQGPCRQALHPPTKPQQGVDSQVHRGDVGGEQSGWLVGSEWRHYDEEARRAVWVGRALEQDLQR